MIDLEQFPTSPAAKRMLSYVTKGWYDNSYVGKWLYQVMGMEMDDAVELIQSLPYQAFPETATWGLQYHEVLFGLPVNPAGKTIEERRKRIMKKRNMRAPLNPYKLEEYIYLTTGVKVHITENVRPYTFRVDFEDMDFVYSLQKLYEEIRNIKPSHLSFLFGLKIEVENREEIALNKIRIHMQVPWITYKYYLDGSWMLDGSVLLGYQDYIPTKIRIRTQTQAKAGCQAKMRVSAGIQNREYIEAGMKKYMYWHLDGQYALDGSKLLGPDIIKEEL